MNINEEVVVSRVPARVVNAQMLVNPNDGAM